MKKVSSHPQILGNKVANHEHTVTLFADNVIVTISNPAESLPKVYEVLKEFNKISYYKVNDT